jgi:glutamate synthase domain-containing protein 1
MPRSLTDTPHHLERDACGIGFVASATGTPSRAVVDLVLEALSRVRHRGAVAADHRTGDGAGVLHPLAPALVPDGLGLAMVFARGTGARAAVEEACVAEGIRVRAWRAVPVDPDALGAEARASQPRIEQALLDARPGEDAELRAFRARRRLDGRGDVYVASLSFRTVVYKALCAADQLAAFYPDLRDGALEVPFGVFHQRFSTNTAPSWERAQPFRLLCHNGEINAIRGNVNWMRARAAALGLDHAPLDETSSDSGMLDNALELLVRGGRDVRHGLAMLIPPAWQGDEELPDDVRSFYRFHAGLVEPWDGPAGIVFSDGETVGAALDRNGLRPLRWVAGGDLVACGSEAGLFDLPDGPVRRGRLGPGEMLVVHPERGLQVDREIKRDLAAGAPYGRWLNAWRRQGSSGEPVAPPEEELAARHVLFGYTREELSLILRPSAAHGHEPTSSMGDDTALPLLSGRGRPLYSYFRQRFAQVTNPAIDHIRERFVMSLSTLLGARAQLLVQAPEAAAGIELDSFFLYPSALGELALVRLDATFALDEGLAAACGRLGDAAEAAVREGHGMLLLSDADASPERPPVPMLLATAAVHHRLVAAGLRTMATLVVESDEPRETHHFACLLGYGAEAIAPRLALQTIASLAANDRLGGDRPSPAEAQARYRRSIEDGVLKVMSKMGISDVASYCGAQIFDALGLDHDLVETAFPGTASTTGGIGLAELEAEALARAEAAAPARPRLENPGYVKFRKGGEPHATSPDVVDALQHAVKTNDMEAAHALRKAVRSATGNGYATFSALVNGRDLVAGQLAALARLRAQCDLDLELLGEGRLLGGDAEATRGDLLDLRVAARPEAGRILAALARVRAGAEVVERLRDRLVRLRRQRAERHAAAREAAHDLLGRLDLVERDRRGVYRLEQVAQLDRVAAVHERGERAIAVARRRGGRRRRGSRRGQDARGRHSHRGRRRRHRRQPAQLDQERGPALGGRARRDAARALGAGVARACPPAGRRRHQDRPRRRDRRAARRGRDQLRDGAAHRRGLPDGALVPRRHVPGRDRHAAPGAAREVRRHAGDDRELPVACCRRGARLPGRDGTPFLRRGRGAQRPAAPPANGWACRAARPRAAAHAADR